MQSDFATYWISEDIDKSLYETEGLPAIFGTRNPRFGPINELIETGDAPYNLHWSFHNVN